MYDTQGTSFVWHVSRARCSPCPHVGALPVEQSLTETARAQHRRGFCNRCAVSVLQVQTQMSAFHR
jgi:hypothetical protein